jgi:hypothetical protein
MGNAKATITFIGILCNLTISFFLSYSTHAQASPALNKPAINQPSLSAVLQPSPNLVHKGFASNTLVS